MKKYYLYLLIVVSIIFYSCGKKAEVENKNSISLSSALSGEKEEGFDKAFEKRKFVFPSDHGAHPSFKTEWWYFTGNLETKDGRKFGYQFTIFRTALTPSIEKKNSVWYSNQIYMGHFTITDIAGDKFYYFERFSRDGNKLAGASSDGFKVWLENWQAVETGNSGQSDFPVVKLFAEENDVKLELILTPLKPIVLHGDEGLSQKGKEPGNASYYYSLTKIKSEGSISLSGKEYKVNGYSWLDREWSTSALGTNQKGWDWFSLQLDNGYEIMYYQLRKKDGTADVYSKGAIIDPDGKKENILQSEVVLEPAGEWKNKNGKTYPSGWHMKIPDRKIDLTITPAVMNQELDLSVKYWEGSVLIKGIYNEKEINGRGYVELTGYAD